MRQHVDVGRRTFSPRRGRSGTPRTRCGHRTNGSAAAATRARSPATRIPMPKPDHRRRCDAYDAHASRTAPTACASITRTRWPSSSAAAPPSSIRRVVNAFLQFSASTDPSDASVGIVGPLDAAPAVPPRRSSMCGKPRPTTGHSLPLARHLLRWPKPLVYIGLTASPRLARRLPLRSSDRSHESFPSKLTKNNHGYCSPVQCEEEADHARPSTPRSVCWLSCSSASACHG